uniref:Uncharacterized protein n=1 Tax=Bubo bubo TaxID=30461 RepID=A0A8C0EW09_BUBBB
MSNVNLSPVKLKKVSLLQICVSRLSPHVGLPVFVKCWIIFHQSPLLVGERGCAGGTHKSAGVTLQVYLVVLVAQESIASHIKWVHQWVTHTRSCLEFMPLAPGKRPPALGG